MHRWPSWVTCEALAQLLLWYLAALPAFIDILAGCSDGASSRYYCSAAGMLNFREQTETDKVSD